MMKKIRLIALLAAFSMLLCGCESYDNFMQTFFPSDVPVSNEPVVRIGVFEPLTGSYASDAEDEIAGIELAHELFPQVLGTKVELVYEDNQSDVEYAPEAAQALADKEVSLILGSCKSTLSLAASDVFAKAQIPTIGITCINPIITETNRYYFRVCSIDSYEGDGAARFVSDGLKASQVSVLKQAGDDFDEALIEAFTSRMKTATGDEFCVNMVEYPEGTEDFSDYLFDLSTASSGVVFFPSRPENAAKVLKQAEESGYEFVWVGSSSWNDVSFEDEALEAEVSDALLGSFYVAGLDVGAVETEMYEKFRAAYAAKYEGKEPSDNAALGFDAYLLALKGIESARSYTDRETIAKRLYNVYKMEGATGNISLNSTGDPIKEVSIYQYGHDGPIPFYVVSPKWGG